jgi:hypothetical protein
MSTLFLQIPWLMSLYSYPLVKFHKRKTNKVYGIIFRIHCLIIIIQIYSFVFVYWDVKGQWAIKLENLYSKLHPLIKFVFQFIKIAKTFFNLIDIYDQISPCYLVLFAALMCVEKTWCFVHVTSMYARTNLIQILKEKKITFPGWAQKLDRLKIK